MGPVRTDMELAPYFCKCVTPFYTLRRGEQLVVDKRGPQVHGFVYRVPRTQRGKMRAAIQAAFEAQVSGAWPRYEVK